MPLALLLRAKLDQVPFSLVLVGDNGLLTSLKLGVHAPLRSRLGYCLQLGSLNAQQSRQSIRARPPQREHPRQPFPTRRARTLDPGRRRITRTINHLAQRAWKPGLPKAVSMSLPRMFKPESIVCLGWLTCCRSTAPFNLKKRESSFMTDPSPKTALDRSASSTSFTATAPVRI